MKKRIMVIIFSKSLAYFKEPAALITFYLMSYNFITQLAPALYFSLFKNNFVTRQGAISGMIIGIVITIYVGITKTTMASLFPSAPHFIQDINIGLVILIVNVIATVVVSIATKQKFSVIQGQAKAQ